MRDYKDKIVSVEKLISERLRLRLEGRTVVLTNGCFDVLHAGHVEYLTFARMQGDALIVALNSDASVRGLKGPERPFVREMQRAAMLAALEAVDYVVIFDTSEPAPLIAHVLPDVLVKGMDWSHYVSGRDIVEQHGGRVVLARLTPGCSTTDLVARIRGQS